MRPIHLVAVLLIALAAVVSVWFATDRGFGVVRAAGANATDAEALLAHANLGDDARPIEEEASTRVAIQFGLSAEERTRAEAEKKKKEARRVVGRVVDRAGQGVGGATVWATTSSNWIQFPLDVEPDGLPSQWIKLQKVEANAEGEFAIEGLDPGPLRIAARSGGFAPTYLDHLELPEYQKHAVGDVVLEKGVRVEGRVLGPNGEPYAGANILIALDCVNRSNLVTVPGRGVPATASGGDGSFVVDQLAAGPWHLLVEAPECIVAECSGNIEFAGGKEAGVVVRLQTGAKIQGKIVCKDAAIPPLLRVAARLQPENEDQGGENERPSFDAPPTERQEQSKDEVRTRYGLVAEDGSFTILGLKGAANYRLAVSNQLEDKSWRGYQAVEAKTVRAPNVGVELLFKPESALVFRVIDDVTGAPIKDLVAYSGIGRERPLRDDKGEVKHVFADGVVRYGELRIPLTNTKPVPLRITANGYKDHENKNTLLHTGQELDLGDIRMKPEHVVVATVRDAKTNEPIEDARVVLSATHDEDDLRSTQNEKIEATLLGDVNLKVARTLADGKARLSAIQNRAVLVVATAKGYRPCRAQRLAFTPDADMDVELKLDHGGSVIVKVTDGTGHPVEGVGIQHRLPKQNLDDENIDGSVKSDRQGVARFDALENGVHGFRVREDDGDVYFWSEDGSEQRETPWREVAVIDGQETNLEFVAPPRGSMYGIVREGGRPVSGAHIKFVPREPGVEKQGQAYWGGGSDAFATVSAYDGSYKIEHLRCGEYSALVVLNHRTMPAEFRVRIVVEPTQRDFDLDISGVEGRVTDPEGRPLAGLVVQCSRSQPGLEIDAPYHMVITEDDRGNPNVDWKQISGHTITTDSNGQYLIPGLATQEPIIVSVSGEWVENGSSGEFTLSPGEVRHGVDFTLRRAGQVLVRLAGGRNKRDEWFECRLSPIGEPAGRHEASTYVGAWNEDGRLESIVPGRYKLTIRLHGEESVPPALESELDVVVGQVTQIPFDPRR